MPARVWYLNGGLLMLVFFIVAGAQLPAESIGYGSDGDGDDNAAVTGDRGSVESATDAEGRAELFAAGSAEEKWTAPPAGEAHQAPFSRIGIGANVSPLGFGINATAVLSDYFDARLMGNFFSYSSTAFEIEGYRAQANLHLASMAASLDWYPFNSVWRISPGVMFYNGNRFSADVLIGEGTDFRVNGQTYYSAKTNATTGMKPFNGSGVLGLNRNPVAFTAAFGFGKFVPRSRRHWSFPAEFGVVFMGAPTLDAVNGGWVCTDAAQTQCSDVKNVSSPVGSKFNSDFQAQLSKWRGNVGGVSVYPMFSYSVVYSFNIR